MNDRIRALRSSRGWSQQQLAERAGVTRQLVSAVEADRHVPNVVAALALAKALGVLVEDLFATENTTLAVPSEVPVGTAVTTCRVGEQVVAVPALHGAANTERWSLADAVVADDGIAWLPGSRTDGLVVAGCDPALGLLGELVERATGQRVVAVHASTAEAVRALAAGTVHGVMVHGPADELPSPPVPARRWHVAGWQVGLAGPDALRSLDELADRRLAVVQREGGAGSQRALQRALRRSGIDHLEGPVGEGHIDVARRVCCGEATAGVTMESAARAFDLDFGPLEVHAVELWIDQRWAALPAVVALLDVLCGTLFTSRAAQLGGYDLVGCGAEGSR